LTKSCASAKEAWVSASTRFQVGPETIVHVNYQLFDAEGELVESSDPELALAFLFGFGQLAPELEHCLLGAAPGDTRRVQLKPGQAFGERDPERILHVSRNELPPGVVIGDEFEAEDESGDVRSLVVLEIDDETVVLDSNHPLAGQAVSLVFGVEAVRPARSDELEEAHLELEAREFEGQTLLPAARLLRRRPT
jgi:FKBP-type peptidyl-prolyl cis-trans isomerase SlyD